MNRPHHQVWLPPKDDILAPGMFNKGTPGPLWFDFSTAPDVKGFRSLSCKANITWAGPRAFRLDQRELFNVSVEAVDRCGEARGRVKYRTTDIEGKGLRRRYCDRD